MKRTPQTEEEDQTWLHRLCEKLKWELNEFL